MDCKIPAGLKIPEGVRELWLKILGLPTDTQFTTCDCSESNEKPAAADAVNETCVPDIMEKLCAAIDEAARRMIHVGAEVYSPEDLRLGRSLLNERIRDLADSLNTWNLRTILHGKISVRSVGAAAKQTDCNPVAKKERTNEQDT